MKLTLISIDGFTRVSIDTFPSTLGREVLVSSTAADAPPETLALLRHVSKRHATFTRTDDGVYVNDAGSMNGTFLNGRNLGEQKAGLRPGDLLSLADKLDFMVNLSPCPGFEVTEPPTLLSKQDRKAHLLLDRTPLHCGKNFERLSDASSETAFFAISVDNNKVAVAPLRPDHGAKIGGRPLQPGHTTLNAGAALSTHSHGEFTVAEPARTDAGQTPPPADTEDADEDKTVYMSEATTFMNVFEKDSYSGAQDSRSMTAPGKDAKSGTGSLFTGKTVLRFIALVTLSALVAGGVFFWYRSTDSYKAQKLFDQKQYDQCLKTVDRLLADKSNKKMTELGKKSLIKVVTPVFLDSLKTTGSKGYSQLHAYRSFSSNIQGADKILETFAFVSRVKRFAVLHDDLQKPDYEHWKNETLAINAQWNKAGPEYKTKIDEISQLEPALQETFETFFSDINDCRENEIYSIKKVTELEDRIRALLHEKDYEAASRLLQNFSSPHANLLNTGKWAEDLRLYQAMTLAYEKADLFNVAAIGEDYLPQTPLFENIAKDFRKNNLPDSDVSMQVARAEDDWRAGAVEEAMARLQLIPPSPVQKKVEDKIAYLADIGRYLALLRDGGNQSRCRAVAGLVGILGDEKTLLKKKYEQPYSACRAKAVQLIPVSSRKATLAFEQFIDKGGISGKMRMEPAVTPHFKRQAELLAAALSESTFTQQLAETFAIPIDKGTQAIFTDIAKELKSQTARIAESVILPSTVIQEKLSLFEIQEVDEWLE